MTLRKQLWLRWTLLSVIGLAIGLPAGIVVGAPLEAIVGMMLVTPLMMGVVGSILGTTQWLVIRRLFKRAGWWVVLSAVGVGLGLTAGLVIVEAVGELIRGEPVRFASTGAAGLALSFAVIGFVGGLGSGALQGLYLRRHARGVGQWILSSALGMSAGFVLGFVVADFLLGGVRTLPGAVGFLIVGGLIAGAVTGRALDRIAGLRKLPVG